MNLTETITTFVATHPSLVGIAIFLSAALESIVVVGAVVPGSGIIIVLAGFVGAARGAIWPLLAWAIAGAAIADGIAYLLGRRYGEHFRDIWPFSKRPDLLDRAGAFFARHGAMSVVIGRFLPGIKAVIPVAAGVLGMRPVVFFSANLISAVLWATVHIVPSAVAGAVLASVGHISSRLIGAVLGLVILLAIAVLGARFAATILEPRLTALYERGIARLAQSRSPLIRRIGAVLDPAAGNLRAHILWGLVLLVSAVSIAAIVRDLVGGRPLVEADAAIGQLFQSLRTPPLDTVMVFVTSYGDGLVIAAAVALLLVVLLLSHAPRTAALVATMFAATSLFVPLIQFAVYPQRPPEPFYRFEPFTFPSPHTVYAALFCGVLAVLTIPTMNATARVAAWATGLVITAIVGISRIYLNTQWPSDVFGGLLLGLALTAIFALIFKDFEFEVEKRFAIPLIAVLGFLALGAAKASLTLEYDLDRYAPRPRVQEIAESDWLSVGWRLLPPSRNDLLGKTEEPFFVQTSVPPEVLAGALGPTGWQKARPFPVRDVLFFLVPAAPLDAFPPLPLMHGGRLPEAMFIRPTSDPDRRLVVRFWASDFILREPPKPPILLGSVTEEKVLHPYEALTTLSDRRPSEVDLANARAAFASLGDAGFRVVSADSALLLVTREQYAVSVLAARERALAEN